MKAIILAAGRGRRLLPETNQKPKCMLEVAEGSRVIDRLIHAFNDVGVRDIALVSGFSSEAIRSEYPSLDYFHNPDWKFTNILSSLMCALIEIDDEVIVSYSDIIYQADTLQSLLSTKAEACISIDLDWRKHYIGRSAHPETEAEKVIVSEGKVLQIGKHLNANEASGEFIGLSYLSSSTVRFIREAYMDAQRKGMDMPFYAAKSLRMAYLTDMLQHLVSSGLHIVPASVYGYWAEVDTPQDLSRVRQNMSLQSKW